MQTVLLKHLKSVTIHLSERLIKYVQPDGKAQPLELHFQDGSVSTCDLVVGSDGIKSAVRRSMYTSLATSANDEEAAAALKKHIDPVWSGVLAYRALVPREVFLAHNGGAVHPALLDPILVGRFSDGIWSNADVKISTAARVGYVEVTGK